MTTRGSQRHAALLGLICLIFVVLATANAGGYRYGIGDQAFYEPATQLRLNPDRFRATARCSNRRRDSP